MKEQRKAQGQALLCFRVLDVRLCHGSVYRRLVLGHRQFFFRYREALKAPRYIHCRSAEALMLAIVDAAITAASIAAAFLPLLVFLFVVVIVMSSYFFVLLFLVLFVFVLLCSFSLSAL